MLLTDLFSSIGIDSEGASVGAEVKGITCDSRKVEEGFVFFAISGSKEDGSKYIEGAIAKWAVGVVASGQWPDVSGKVYCVENTRLALSKAAKAFYPVQPDNVAAVTGTDGKTYR